MDERLLVRFLRSYAFINRRMWRHLERAFTWFGEMWVWFHEPPLSFLVSDTFLISPVFYALTAGIFDLE